MKKSIQFYTSLLFLTFLLSACGSIGNPDGGPKDVSPPRLLSSDPGENAVGFSKKRIELTFNELISIKSPGEKVIISPPQKNAPVIKAVANKAVVQLMDSLIPGTTYTIDFTDAIVDFNEGNKFGDYAFSFSTGGHIDSLRISGTIVDASNLNPLSGLLVGSHTGIADSTFRTKILERISKSTSDGTFSLKGLSDKAVSVFVLGDKNRDYRFSGPGEMLAFTDTPVKPYTEPGTRNDTVWKDTATIDSIVVRPITCYKPDNLVLRAFAEDFSRQYLARKERSPRNKINLTFGAHAAVLPRLQFLGEEPAKEWYLLEKNPTNDTLTYWITDSTIIKTDTLHFTLDYLKTDSLNRLLPQTDSLTFISRTFKPKASSKKEVKKEENVPPPVLDIKTDLRNMAEIYSKPVYTFEEPVAWVKDNPGQLYIKKDTLWVKTGFRFEKDTLRLRDFHLLAKWQYGSEYRFTLDSAAFRSVYGNVNDKINQTFRIRKEEDYSRLIVTVTGFTGPAFVELLSKSDKPLRKEKLQNGVADFKNLAPGTYYLRAVADDNDNGVWDTGNYDLKKQPEQVFYNPRPQNLRANWDVKESWDINDLPLLKQKPSVLIQKKAKE